MTDRTKCTSPAHPFCDVAGAGGCRHAPWIDDAPSPSRPTSLDPSYIPCNCGCGGVWCLTCDMIHGNKRTCTEVERLRAALAASTPAPADTVTERKDGE